MDGQGHWQSSVTTGEVVANGVAFVFLAAGDVDDTSRPLALLLHGFPDTPYTWRFLLPQLAQEGYRAVAPFMRGYAPTETGSTYQVGALVQDVNALHDALGGAFGAGVTQDVVIGHDWGAIAALGSDVSSEFVPDELGKVRWAKVVTLAVPPASGALVARAVQSGDYEQIQRGMHFWFFGHTLNSNAALAANDLGLIDRIWRDWTTRGFDASFYIGKAKESLRLEANRSAALDYYRATAWGLAGTPGTTFSSIYPSIDPGLIFYDLAGLGTDGIGLLVPKRPTLYLHGTKEAVFSGAVIEEAVQAANSLSSDFLSEQVPGASHFPHLERPSFVNQRILGFLRQ